MVCMAWHSLVCGGRGWSVVGVSGLWWAWVVCGGRGWSVLFGDNRSIVVFICK